MASPNNDAEEENGGLDFESSSFWIDLCKLESQIAKDRKLLAALRKATQTKTKRIEELIREYDGLCVSAVPKDCLKTIMLWTGFSAFIPPNRGIADRDGEPPNWPPVQVVRVVFMFLAVAFYGSLLGLLMKRNFPKLSFYSGYVSLISLLFALGMIAFFTVMWVFERI